jgi:hypothetical protein
MGKSMVSIRDGVVTVELNGFKRIVTMKSRVTFKVRDIVSVKRVDYERRPDLRAPGISLPGAYAGGSFYDPSTRSHQFWDSDGRDVVEVKLRNEFYDTIILDPRDPDKLVRRLEREIDRESRK